MNEMMDLMHLTKFLIEFEALLKKKATDILNILINPLLNLELVIKELGG
jgi:hypothetical protein